MSSSKIILALVAVIVIILGVSLAFRHAPVEQALGNSGATPTVFDNVNLTGVLSVGVSQGNPLVAPTLDNGEIYSYENITHGGLNSTSTPASMTLAPADINNESFISMTPSAAGSISVTFPATTTSGMSSFLPNVGDMKDLIFHNATSTAGVNITLVAGTGTLLQSASSTKAIIPLGVATLHAVRKVNGDIVFQMIPSTP